MTATATGAEVAAAHTAGHDVLTAVGPRRVGVVNAVTRFLLDRDLDVTELQQFDDPRSGRLFLRIAFSGRPPADRSPTGAGEPTGSGELARLRDAFAPIAAGFEMIARWYDPTPPRTLVMVSRLGHCLNDLIFRWRAGSLGADLVVVGSNHDNLAPMAQAAGLPFVHLPVTPDTKPAAELALRALVTEYQIDLVVLARYMQVLSDELSGDWAGRAINIHHSFLPGFKGARPYHQAYDRGVKLVGATAHYVTGDLDEGPIIEQEVIRVDHTYDPEALATIGRDAEALALSRAVRWHGQHRVLLNGSSTVVFR